MSNKRDYSENNYLRDNYILISIKMAERIIFSTLYRGSKIDPIQALDYLDIQSSKPLEISSSSSESSIIAVTAPVGLYRNKNKFTDYIFIVFNPQDPSDDVYIEDPQLRSYYLTSKYVHKDIIGSSIWDLSIDEPQIKYIIGKLITTRMDYESRRSPVLVARFCSDFISYVDGDQYQGLLEGHWGKIQDDTDDPDIINPCSWRSTAAVLKEYIRINKNLIKEGNVVPNAPGLHDILPNAVKYGQCWVFACVLQSFMRVFGIPCRCIKNYNSAHDSMRDIVISTCEGEKAPMWNYHVWNEVWMRRRDLESDSPYKGYGWQILDATPQGLSTDALDRDKTRMACGPCPLKAVYDMAMDVKYDLSFVTCEVNAVNVTYLWRHSQYYIYDVTSRLVGTKIVGECHDGSPEITIGANGKECIVYPLTSVFSSYINRDINPASKIIGERDYTPKLSFGVKGLSDPKHLIDVAEFSVSIDQKPNSKIPLRVTTLISLERDVGPLMPHEVSPVSVIIIDPISIEPKVNGKICKYKLNPEIYKNLPIGCRIDHKHDYRCQLPTLRIVIQHDDTMIFTKSQVKIFAYQLINYNGQSIWIARPMSI